MKPYNSIQQLIGNTPLLQLTKISLPHDVNVFAKLEFFNPGGSIKDRLGVELIDNAMAEGKLKEGSTLIEPTAGNTGIGLALAAVGKELNVIFVTPEKFSQEKQELMRALGATVVNTPTEDGMTGAIEKAKKLVQEIPDSYYPAQFANDANPHTYYKTLAPEIYHALDGKVDVFIAGAGTGGTFMGCAKFLKEKNPNIKTVIVEPEGSILNGGEAGPHKTEGIGMEFLPSYMDETYFDAIYTVSDEKAFAHVKELAIKEGLLVGSSSGAALEACLQEAKLAKPGTNIVTIFPDSSERYLSKSIYQGGR